MEQRLRNPRPKARLPERLILAVGKGEIMKHQYIILAGLLAFCGCTSVRHSAVAEEWGYPDHSRVVDIGPYTVHYGSDGNSDFLVVAKGNQNLYHRMGTNSWTVVYDRHACSLYDSEDRNGDGAADQVTVSFPDASGEESISFVDTNADGCWDQKIDLRSKAVYDWKDEHWVGRKGK